MLYYNEFETYTQEACMDKSQLKMGKKDGVKRVAEAFGKLLKQKPSKELIESLKRIKEKEDATKDKKVAIDRDAEA